jgi:hypothetical protein
MSEEVPFSPFFEDFVFRSRVFFFPIRPSRLYVYNIAFEVENFIPNSLAASFIVTYFDITR